MRKKENKPWRALCLAIVVTSLLAACDTSHTETSEEQVVPLENSASINQVNPAESTQAEPALPTRESYLEVAPGNIVVLALSPNDSRAVIKTAQGKMQLIKPGEVVQGTEATLVDIMHDRLVLENVLTKPSGLKIKEIVWVYKAVDGVSRILPLNTSSPELKEYTVNKVVSVAE